MRTFAPDQPVIDLVDYNVAADFCDECGGSDALGAGNLFAAPNITLLARQHTLQSLTDQIRTLTALCCARRHHGQDTSHFDCPNKFGNLLCGHNWQVRDTRRLRPQHSINSAPYSPSAFGHLALASVIGEGAGADLRHIPRKLHTLAYQLRCIDGGAEMAYRIVQDKHFDFERSTISSNMVRADWNALPTPEALSQAIGAHEASFIPQVSAVRLQVLEALCSMREPELVQLSFDSATVH